MKIASPSANEKKRIAVLKKYNVLDTPNEPDFDELTKIASSICETPIALISLVDECRQWFKSKVGLAAEETHRDVAFCAHAILSESPLIVPDAHLDDRFKDNPLVVGPPFVRFYVGVPLRSYSGENIGTLCVIDHVPRVLESWKLEALIVLARQVIHLMELRQYQNNSDIKERNFLAAIAHNMHEGAVLQDKEGKIVMANSAALNLLELSEDQLLGRASTDPRWGAIREDGSSLPGHEHPAMLALSTGEDQLLKRMGITIPNGAIRWLQINSNLIYPTGTGGKKYVLSTFTDITSEIENTKKISALNEQHRLILDSIPALVAYWDKNQICQFANKSYLDWFGNDREQLLGKSMYELLGPTLYQANLAHIQNALKGEPQTFDRELKYLKTGETRYTSAQYIPDNENGQIKGFYVLVFDVTELKRLELKAVDEARKAQEASKAKSDFLANMSHEIRTPLNGVIGMASVLAGTTLDQNQMVYVGTIRNSGQMLLTLVNDILDLSKAESGKLEIESTTFELNKIVLDVERSLIIAANKKGLIFSRAISNEVPQFLSGDPFRLAQVLVNLVNNAIKFTTDGNISVDVSLNSFDGDRAILNFEVSDTGIGISNTEIERLFTPFSQADSSTTRKYGGTGLGLSICKRLVNLMGGKIGVRSEVGKGSVFWFTIEMGVAKPVPVVTSMNHTNIERTLHILLAEDNSVNQLIASSMFEQLGHSVMAVANGHEAVEALSNGKFDLVFMDCQMPEMDGYEATKAIRNLKLSELSNIPIIAMTANAMKGDREKCLAVGMDDYVSKPIELEELSLAINRNLVPQKKEG
ncbi:MAG: hypothetical protein B7Y39_07790 [Bdellovibrio sp. 28-41-41]|nr:MAG: hypothetical protein B7Y39_07790 [Bdellovibrio sp. 28-41-41]